MSATTSRTLPFATLNDRVCAEYEPYVVATPWNRPALDASPFGLATRWEIDPTRMGSATFMDLLQRLDGLTFGPEGMPMDKWVFYDCSELPGFLYGFAAPVETLEDEERELFGVPDAYTGPVPFSMYIAIPMHDRGAWFGHNLASLNRTFPDRGLRYLGTMTKALALKAYGVQRFVGATQWTSHALGVHTRFGPLELLTAYTPAHSIPETLTYAFDVNDAILRAAAGDPTAELPQLDHNAELEAHDVEGMKALQARLEAGAKVWMTGAPSQRGQATVHQLHIEGA